MTSKLTLMIGLALAGGVLVAGPLGCTDDGGGEDTSGGTADTGTTGDTNTGDGDGDSATGDGDGDGDTTTGDGDGDTTTGDGDGDGDTATGDGDGDSGEFVEFAPVHQILMDQGCTAGYCHGAGQGGLTMTDAATAYMNLVDVDATTGVCGLQKRVVPGEPDQSIMWMRARPLVMDMGMACADKMPQGSEGLPDAEAQIVYDWIAGGALP